MSSSGERVSALSSVRNGQIPNQKVALTNKCPCGQLESTGWRENIVFFLSGLLTLAYLKACLMTSIVLILDSKGFFMINFWMLLSEPGKIELTVHLSTKKAAEAFGAFYCSFYHYQLETARIPFSSGFQPWLTDTFHVFSSPGHGLRFSAIIWRKTKKQNGEDN